MRYALLAASLLLLCTQDLLAQQRRGSSHNNGNRNNNGGNNSSNNVINQANRAAAALNAGYDRSRAKEHARYQTKKYKDDKQKAAAAFKAHRGDEDAEKQRLADAKISAAPRLTDDQLNPTTGVVSWPKLMKGNAYQEDRVAISQLLADRAQGKPHADFANKLEKHVNNIDLLLKADMSSANVNDYMTSRKFLTSLAEESVVRDDAVAEEVAKPAAKPSKETASATPTSSKKKP